MRHNQRALILVGAVVCCLACAVWTAAQHQPPPEAFASYGKGQEALRRGMLDLALSSFRKAVELDPEYADACKALADAAKSVRQNLNTPVADKTTAAMAADILRAMNSLYAARAARAPDKAVYQWALGEFDDSQTQDAAERCFRKAVAMDPSFARAYSSLAATLEYRGDLAASRDARRKAWELRPEDPEVLAAYVRSLGAGDRALRRKLTDEFLSRFSKHPEGMDLLSSLALLEDNLPARILMLEQLKLLYRPNEVENCEWYIRFLFDAYNRTDPLKALSLAEDMSATMPSGTALRDWQVFAAYARSLMTARSMLDRGAYADAARLLENLQPPYLVATDPQTLLQADAAGKAGDAQKAYRILSTAMAAEPSDGIRPTLMSYGAKMRRSQEQVETDVWTLRLKKKSVVKDFKLKDYRNGKEVRLSDFRGRVVLLTFWQPSNWTCRDELPYLQSMLDKYGQQGFTVITINRSPREDGIAALLMGRYGFISLRTPDEEWAGNNFYIDDTPYSILIDRQGRALFSPAFWGYDPQHAFELELQAMLAFAPKKK